MILPGFFFLCKLRVLQRYFEAFSFILHFSLLQVFSPVPFRIILNLTIINRQFLS